MSINSAMLAGVSGLVANSSALAAISDNISNVNTVAYKRNQVDFGTQVTAQVAGRYSAGGVHGTSRQFVGQQGLVQSASSPTDLAVSGNGFFVTTAKGAGVTAADTRLFTRAGAFTVDGDGYLVNDAHLFLQGWPVAANGTVTGDPSDLSKLTSINVHALSSAVSSTSQIGISANLDKQAVLSPAAAASPTTYAATAGDSMADYADDPTTGTKPDFTVEVPVIDSVGGAHKLVMGFLKSAAAPNQWYAEIYASPAGDVDGGATAPPGQLAAGILNFNQDGTIDLATSTLFGSAGAPATLTLDSSGGTAPKWDDSLGIAGESLNFDLRKLGQYAATSTVNSVSVDGSGVGQISGVQVDEDGFVSAVFDNGQYRRLAQIALATFPNPDGLTAVSGNAYRASGDAGQFVIHSPGNGAGHISPSSLEASTVDLSSEFTGLIQTQKAYSASSKIISTADQMLETLINIIR